MRALTLLTLLHSYLLLRPLAAWASPRCRILFCFGVHCKAWACRQQDRSLMSTAAQLPAAVILRAHVLQNAARLLVRIAAHLDAFPAHAAAILTSTVVECHR